MTGKPQCRPQRRVVRWGRSRVWPAAGGTPGDAARVATNRDLHEDWPGGAARSCTLSGAQRALLRLDQSAQSTYASCPARESQDPSDLSHPEHLRRRLTLRRGPSQLAAASCLPRWRSRSATARCQNNDSSMPTVCIMSLRCSSACASLRGPRLSLAHRSRPRPPPGLLQQGTRSTRCANVPGSIEPPLRQARRNVALSHLEPLRKSLSLALSSA